MPPKKKGATTSANDTATGGGIGGPASKKQRRSSTNLAGNNNNNTKEKGTPAAKGAEKKNDNAKDNQKNSNNLKVKTDVASPSAAAASTNSTTNKNAKHIKITPVSGSGSAMDNHPYARGSVIEVLHGVKEKDSHDDDSIIGEGEEKKDGDDFDDWWDQDSDEENENTSNEKGDGDDEKNEKKNNDENEVAISVRLCDIIDRVALANTNGVNDNKDSEETAVVKYRYYVHYRDFNRRMDEWISMDRIVSPPSIGNAKARAIKREEEKKKRMIQREKEKEEKRRAVLKARSVDVTAPRASRRRSTAGVTPSSGHGSSSASLGNNNNSNSSGGGTQSGNNNNNGGINANSEGSAADGGGITTSSSDKNDNNNAEQEGIRRGTRTRRRSTAAGGEADDAATTGGNTNNNAGGGDTVSNLPIMAAEKGTVALPTIAATDSTKVGEHVVQTIAAQELDEHEGLDDAALREHEEVTKVKNVAFLELGPHQMSTWYFSPLPKELLSEHGFIEVLYVCEFTLRMFSRKQEIRRFQSRLPADRRHPPGNEIYRSGNLSMFEVDGFEERIYCQNLCYIAKLFLDHKTLYFDVDPFLFYVLCEVDDRGFHPVGYYSKEKYSDVGYNLACILTFPSHQRKGYGRFLIAFSYELSKKEEKVGSPEKPMSDLGQQAYKPYWASTIVDFLLNQCPNANSMSIMDISKMTSIMAEDIVFTLNQLSILKIINGVYFIAAEEGLLRTLAKKYPVKNPKVDASKLHWTPFVMEVRRDKFSIHSKKPSVEGEETRGAGGF
jgi:histone acetyltransferase MYST1